MGWCLPRFASEASKQSFEWAVVQSQILCSIDFAPTDGLKAYRAEPSSRWCRDSKLTHIDYPCKEEFESEFFHALRARLSLREGIFDETKQRPMLSGACFHYFPIVPAPFILLRLITG